MHVCLTRFRDATGIVTLDADGQHDPEDARRVGNRLEDEKPGTLVLGVRRFLGPVPLRSRIGNTLTRWLFRLLLGVSLTDTQTGLRGIPGALAKRLLRLRSRRYDFEMEMLMVTLPRGGRAHRSVRDPHADLSRRQCHLPLPPRLRLPFHLLRAAPLRRREPIFAAIDNLVFITVFTAMARHPGRTGGRSGRRAHRQFPPAPQLRVPGARGAPVFPMLRSFLSVAGFGVIAYGMIHFLADQFGTPVVLAKIGVATLLFIMNFIIQPDLVFQRNREN